MSSLRSVTLRRALAVFAALLALGVLAQAPIVPAAGGWKSVVAVATGAAGLQPERQSAFADRPADYLTVRKLATAAALALVVALLWGLQRGDASSWVLRGIPDLPAEALGLFRIVLGLALIKVFVATGPVEPGLAIWVHWGMLASAAAFAAGCLARAAIVSTAAFATVQTLLLLQRQSVHDWGLPVVTLWLLVVVPWGDALSLDAVWRRRRGLPPLRHPPVHYGLGVWIPVLTLGVAYAAAAFAKFDSSGLAWITGGAVRYHFIEDAHQAPIDWGLRVAASDVLAGLVSGAAVLTESVLILGVLARRPLTRLGFGIVAAVLMSCFYLFQGVLWQMWWIWLLAFLPWEAIAAKLHVAGSMPAGPLRGPALRGWTLVLVGGFVAQQVIASGARIEIEPLISDYGMYSHTFASHAEFDAHLRRKYSVVTVDADGSTWLEEPVFDWDRSRFAAPRRTRQPPPGAR